MNLYQYAPNPLSWIDPWGWSKCGGGNKEPTYIDPKKVANKTPTEIETYAKQQGLIVKGKEPMSGKGSYTDPITGKQRILIHTNPKDGTCPHCHVNDSKGRRLDINGKLVHPESPGAHLPLKLTST